MKEKQNKINWSRAAQEDLFDIWEYLVQAADAGVANQLLREINLAADRIGSVDPRMYRVRSDVMPDLLGGLRSAPAHPYAIFYRIDPRSPGERTDVQIIRVLHQQRDLPTVLSQDNPA